MPGISVKDLSADQKAHVQSVLATLIEPYRQSDRDLRVACPASMARRPGRMSSGVFRARPTAARRIRRLAFGRAGVHLALPRRAARSHLGPCGRRSRGEAQRRDVSRPIRSCNRRLKRRQLKGESSIHNCRSNTNGLDNAEPTCDGVYRLRMHDRAGNRSFTGRRCGRAGAHSASACGSRAGGDSLAVRVGRGAVVPCPGSRCCRAIAAVGNQQRSQPCRQSCERRACEWRDSPPRYGRHQPAHGKRVRMAVDALGRRAARAVPGHSARGSRGRTFWTPHRT